MIHADWGWLALVGGAVLLRDPRRRRFAAGGLGALALALAALRVGGPSPLPGDFAAVELALVLLGLALVAGAGLPAVRNGWRGGAVAALLAVGVILLRDDLGAVAAAAPIGGAVAAVGVVAGAAAVAWAAAGMVLRRLPPSTGADERIDPRWVACVALGVLLAALGTHLLLILAGVVLAAAASAGRAPGPRRVPMLLPPAIAVTALAPAWWLLSAIAGDQRLATVGLTELPLSPAAESLLAPLLLVAAWSVAGLWPLPRSRLAGLAGLAGVLVVARVAVPALPDGLDHWRPLAFPILGVGLGQAVVAQRWPAVLIGGALFGLVSGSAEGVAAAWWLGPGAVVAELANHLARRELAWLWRVAGLAAGAGTLSATVAGLKEEVVYTTLTVAGLAILLAAGAPQDSPGVGAEWR